MLIFLVLVLSLFLIAACAPKVEIEGLDQLSPEEEAELIGETKKGAIAGQAIGDLCDDSDKNPSEKAGQYPHGKNFFVKGTRTGVYAKDGTDYCYTYPTKEKSPYAGKTVLKEWACIDSKKPGLYTQDCAKLDKNYQCVDGACVAPLPPVEVAAPPAPAPAPAPVNVTNVTAQNQTNTTNSSGY